MSKTASFLVHFPMIGIIQAYLNNSISSFNISHERYMWQILHTFCNCASTTVTCNYDRVSGGGGGPGYSTVVEFMCTCINRQRKSATIII